MNHSDFRDWLYDELEREQEKLNKGFNDDLNEEDEEDKPL